MSFLKVSSAEGIVTWCISRPERLNAVGVTVSGELRRAAEQLPPDTRALILRTQPVASSGQRIWIAGGDLKELAELDALGAQKYVKNVSRAAYLLSKARAPVISVVEGAAIGGGAEIALMGDVRLASDDAALHFKQLDVGLATGYGHAHRLVDLIGLARSQDLLYGGRRLDAASALALGLFHEVHPSEALEKALASWTTRFLELDPSSVAAQKAMFRAACYATPASREAGEWQIFRKIWGNPKHAGFLKRFLDREYSAP